MDKIYTQEDMDKRLKVERDMYDILIHASEKVFLRTTVNIILFFGTITLIMFVLLIIK